MTVMVGGFGVPGTPFALIDALIKAGVSDLPLIKNEANEVHRISYIFEFYLLKKPESKRPLQLICKKL